MKLTRYAYIILLTALMLPSLSLAADSRSDEEYSKEFVPLTPEELAPYLSTAKEWEAANQELCSAGNEDSGQDAMLPENCMYELSLWCEAKTVNRFTGKEKWTNKKCQSLYNYCTRCQSAPVIPDVVAQAWVGATITATQGANAGWYRNCYLDWKYIGPCQCRDF